MEQVDLPGLSIFLMRYRAGMHFLDKRPPDWLYFMGWLSADGLPDYRGTELTVDDIIVAHVTKFEGHSSPNCK